MTKTPMLCQKLLFETPVLLEKMQTTKLFLWNRQITTKAMMTQVKASDYKTYVPIWSPTSH